MLDYPSVAVQTLFWLMTAAVLVLPLRSSLFVYLLLVQVDGSGPFFSSSASLGGENLLKIVVIPILLLLRMGDVQSWLRARWPRTAHWWFLLFAYATLAILWSPARLSGVKMSGYLFSYMVLFPVLLAAWTKGLINPEIIEANLWCTFALGILQTYALGNPYGTLEVFATRFTTFSSPQALAVYFLAVVAILMDIHPKKLHTTISIVLAIVGIVLTGSRYVFLCLAIFFVVRAVLHAERRSFWLVTKRVLQVSAAVALLAFLVVEYAPENRLNELFQSSFVGEDKYEEVATIVWRLGIYKQAFDDISQWSKPTYLVGAGTSSGGNVKATFDPEYAGEDLDANRSLHNEFLRAFYEWGVIGFLLLAGFLLSLFRQFKPYSRWPRASTALSFFPTIVLSLAIENILSNPGAPAGTAIVLLLTYALAERVTGPTAVATAESAPLAPLEPTPAAPLEPAPAHS